MPLRTTRPHTILFVRQIVLPLQFGFGKDAAIYHVLLSMLPLPFWGQELLLDFLNYLQAVVFTCLGGVPTGFLFCLLPSPPLVLYPLP